jgi:predicted ArsR family transcriptional regulator
MTKPGPKPKVTRAELLENIPDKEDEPPVTGVTDISMQLELSDQRVRVRLRRLVEEQVINSGRINGGKNILFWRDSD